jgi:hypothetical protein
MASSDEEVRGNLRKLIEAFATPDQRAERSGFHLYCLQVAMGFKKIYNELIATEPPGLQKDELQKNSVHVSYAITVGEIDQWKVGGRVHRDVQDVLDKIKDLKTGDSQSLRYAQLEISRQTNDIGLLKTSNANAVKEWGAELERQMNAKDEYHKKEMDRVTTIIDKLKKDKSVYESNCNKQVTDMETQMDAAIAALKIAERDNADLKSKIVMSSQLDRVEKDLKGALSRLEGSDGILVSYIKLLLSDKNASGNPVAFVTPATADLVKSLMPKEISAGTTTAVLEAKNAEIESLKQSTELLKSANSLLESNLTAEQGKVAGTSSLSVELSAEKKKVEDLTSNEKKYKESILSMETFLYSFVTFNRDLNIGESSFDDTIISNHMLSVESIPRPHAVNEDKWKKIKKIMLKASQLMIIYDAYLAAKSINSLTKEHPVLKNIKKTCDLLKTDEYKQAFMNISAASLGFESLEKAVDCISVALERTGFTPNVKCIFKEENIGTPETPIFIFAIHQANYSFGSTIPSLAVQMIDFATNKYCLLSSSMKFATRWMGMSTNEKTKLEIAGSISAIVERLAPQIPDPGSEILIQFFKAQSFSTILKMCPPVLFGQILYDCVPRKSGLICISDDIEKFDDCRNAVQKFVKFMSNPTSSGITFKESDIKILTLLHGNPQIVSKLPRIPN